MGRRRRRRSDDVLRVERVRFQWKQNEWTDRDKNREREDGIIMRQAEP